MTTRVLVDPAPDLEVVGEASTGREALDLARATRADVVLMPDLDGLDVTQDLTAVPASGADRLGVVPTG